MEILKIITIIIILNVLLPLYAQVKNVRGTYLLSNNEEEYIQIDKDKYKIIRTHVCPGCIDLDEGDSLASCGRVEYVQAGFVKLTSDPDSIVVKTVKVEESYNPQINDSVKIRFVFPFKGKYRIRASVGYPSKSTKCDTIIIPREKYVLGNLFFEIYNLDLICNSFNGGYLGRIAFYFSDYQLKHQNSNSLLITIPRLTNSYFACYYIDGEYAKIENDKIIWRNRAYIKVSDDLITPKIESGERSIDDINGVDWVD
ncbi:MAG: hypothetical protein Q8914_11650 [Bacteroidota bacterium]|nr:hypothetical protein [Bacteroidota bacterium]